MDRCLFTSEHRGNDSKYYDGEASATNAAFCFLFNSGVFPVGHYSPLAVRFTDPCPTVLTIKASPYTEAALFKTLL